MSLNLVSPGIRVREVDLTVGRIDAVNEQVGAFAGPFVRGPIETPVLVETEQDLLNTFGKPSENSNQYEYWLTASSYLSYGGVLRVVRANSASLVNAHYPVSTPVSLKITSTEDFNNNHQSDTDWIYAAKDPGSWANGIKVCVIDNFADQRVSIGTFGLQVGYALTAGISTSFVTTAGNVETFNGFVKAIVTKVNVGNVDVKILSKFDNSTQTYSSVSYSENGLNRIPDGTKGTYWQAFNSVGTATSLEKFRLSNNATVGVGSTVIVVPDSIDLSTIAANDLIQNLNGSFSARVVGVSTGQIIVNTASGVSLASTTLVVTYTKNALDGTLDKGEGLLSNSTNTVVDWYNQQTLGLSNSTVYWKSIAPKPSTSQYAFERNGSNDEIHVAVVDDSGSVTGIAGNILEKFTNLSKATDARVSPSENIYYKNYVSNNSTFIFAGSSGAVTGVNFTTLAGLTQSSGGTIAWGQEAVSVNFGCIGSQSFELNDGFDYSSGTGGMDVSLSDILNAYEVFRNPTEIDINFIMSGPSGGATIFESQAKANRLISIAEERKDCVVTVSPHRAGVVNVTNTDSQTTNIINFYDSVSSSSYAVFDSGYKYVFDRFNNQFRYVPLNGDIAGLMARTSINNYAWFSPAGSSRGVINNAVKLAYNPSQAQRDLLYPKRINPVVFSPGAGIILFGDKTALSYASAFDRINVRRLFLTVEATIERAARAQLFEFNDVITRTNFVNIIEPYLRDVKAKRGITDFLVICDESNNTPDVIDANQFKADIFIKPARSINFIGLTFVANRTGISFEEIVGTV